VTRPRCFAVVVALVAGLSSPSAAQIPKESEDSRLRSDCRLDAKALSKGHPAPKSDLALSHLVICNESAGLALPSLWAIPPTDSAALEQLVQTSARILDQRVYVSVRKVATNTSSPLGVRVAALRVLASLVESRKLYYPTNWLRPSPDSNLAAVFSHGPYQTVGAEPLEADVSTDIVNLIKTLAQTDPDPLLRFAARHLIPTPR